MKILLLEDNPSDADLTKRGILKSIPDCEIETASTLKIAREKLLYANQYNVAILDMELPDGNGLELLLEIRQKNLNLAVVIVTGSGDEEVAAAALKAGANDYVVKKQDYTVKLAKNIHFALQNFKLSLAQKTEIINVLYVEHNKSDVDLTVRHLKKYAPYIKLDIADSAGEAIELIKKNNKYQVILMDFRLPGLNSFELIKIIRQELQLHLPTILVTGQGNEDIAVEALKLGFNDYLTKNKKYLNRLPAVIVGASRQSELESKQAALIESEKKYRTLIENQGEGIGIVDTNENFVFANPAAEEIFGVSSGELIDKNLNDFVVHEHSHTLESESLKRSRGEKTSYEIEIINAKSEKRIVLVTATPQKEKTGKTIGSFGIFRDITKRKNAERALQESYNFNSTILQTIPFGLNIVDENGTILFINENLKKLFGNNALGRKCWELYRDDKKQCSNCPLHKNIELNKTQHIETSGVLGGKLFQITHTGMLFKGKKAVLEMFQDITEKKQAENDLILAKEQAEESDRLKTAFLTNMSHEIRTPMNGILGFISLLNEPDLSEEKKASYAEIINNSGQRLLNTVNDIIEISKIDSGIIKVNLEQVNIIELLADQYLFFSLEASNKGLDFDFSVPETDILLTSDISKLESIVSNLISNAIKFTEKGKVEFGIQQNENLTIYVKDTGKGIAADKTGIIFERFRQADLGYTRGYEGNGLGLAIAKAYAEMLNGKIWVESEPGVGSTFYVQLHNNTEAASLPLKKEIKIEKQNQVESLVVLIAEDDDTNYQLLAEMLDKQKVKIIRAKNGKESVEICKENDTINLVLMDINMPIMNGYEASKQILEFRPGLHIIAQTAHTFQEERELAFKSGCVDYISKPISKDKLLEILQNYGR